MGAIKLIPLSGCIGPADILCFFTYGSFRPPPPGLPRAGSRDSGNKGKAQSSIISQFGALAAAFSPRGETEGGTPTFRFARFRSIWSILIFKPWQPTEVSCLNFKPPLT